MNDKNFEEKESDTIYISTYKLGTKFSKIDNCFKFLVIAKRRNLEGIENMMDNNLTFFTNSLNNS